MARGFDISVVREGSASVVCLHGEIDLASRDDLARAVSDCCVDAGADELILDLVAVTFMDSAGMAGLVSGYHDAARAGRGFRLRGAAGAVLQALQLTGLDQLFLPVAADGRK